MEASPETLIAGLVVLVLAALGLLAFLARALLKTRSAGAPHKSSGEDAPAADDVSDRMEVAVATPADSDFSALPEPVATAEPASEPPEEIQPAFTSPPEPAVHQPESAAEPEVVPLMQIWQGPDGILEVELGGKRYRSVYDIRDGEVGKELFETIKRLIAFSRGKDTRVANTAPLQTPTGPLSEPTAEEQPDAFLEQLQKDNEVRKKAPRITADPVPFRPRSAAQETGITLNLAGEIERLLQIRIKSSPEFDQRHIHVVSAPDGGLLFDVGGARYTALDDIPEPQVQALIRAAIDDWEARR